MNKYGTASQVITHPTGGGAIKGLGETFSPDLHTGTGNLSVPIALPMGRAGLQPEFTLVYSTGQGNGPYGWGGSLSVPVVSRDTSKSAPIYDNEQDVFLLSGAEQLVPTSSPSPGTIRYCPRTEGLFARIIHLQSNQDDYWEVRSRNGLTSLYGHPGQIGQDSAVVTKPDDNQRIFSWHPTQTVDPFGNRIEYEYEREPSREEGPHRWDQVYLKTIRYGDYGPADNLQFMVTVDFVYEARPDSFSMGRGIRRPTGRRHRFRVGTHCYKSSPLGLRPTAPPYDSGAGDGPCGFGSRLCPPSITHKTDKGSPQYFDSGAQESDILILSDTDLRRNSMR